MILLSLSFFSRYILSNSHDIPLPSSQIDILPQQTWNPPPKGWNKKLLPPLLQKNANMRLVPEIWPDIRLCTQIIGDYHKKLNEIKKRQIEGENRQIYFYEYFLKIK